MTTQHSQKQKLTTHSPDLATIKADEPALEIKLGKRSAASDNQSDSILNQGAPNKRRRTSDFSGQEKTTTRTALTNDPVSEHKQSQASEQQDLHVQLSKVRDPEEEESEDAAQRRERR